MAVVSSSQNKLEALLQDVVSDRHVDISELRETLKSVSIKQRMSTIISIQNATNNTAIHNAAQRGHTDIVKCLVNNITVEQRLDILKVQNKFGSTALHGATEEGHKDIVQCLLVDVTVEQKLALLFKIQNKDEGTALHGAADRGYTDIIKFLLDDIPIYQRFGLLLKIQNQLGNTAVHYAAWRGHIDIIKYLLDDIPVDQRLGLINIQNKRGETVLHYAAERGHTTVIKHILSHLPLNLQRELLNISNKDGESCLDVAKTLNRSEIVNYIVRCKEPVEMTNGHSNSRKANHPLGYNLALPASKRPAAVPSHASANPKIPRQQAESKEKTTSSSLHSLSGGQKHDNEALQQSEQPFKSPYSRVGPKAVDELVEGKLLGTGAYGSVYLQYDSHTNRMLAIKKVELGPVTSADVTKEIKELNNEVSLMEKLRHERIVQYIRAEIVSDGICIYMEYMVGGSVKDQLDTKGCLSEDLTKKYTIQILEGLSYLHGECIIHRDVKGSNILCDGRGNIKLADFGVSKQMLHIQTLKGETNGNTNNKGTAHWMAPEVIQGTDYGRRADIWSTGATVVEMLTSHPPWHELSLFSAMLKIGSLRKAHYVLDPATSREAEDFLSLTFTPEEEQRPRAEELLQHPWLKT